MPVAFRDVLLLAYSERIKCPNAVTHTTTLILKDTRRTVIVVFTEFCNCSSESGRYQRECPLPTSRKFD